MNVNMIKLNDEISISPNLLRAINGDGYLNSDKDLLNRKINTQLRKIQTNAEGPFNSFSSSRETDFDSSRSSITSSSSMDVSVIDLENELSLNGRVSTESEIAIGTLPLEELKEKVKRELEESARKSERLLKKQNFDIVAPKDLKTKEAISEWLSLEEVGKPMLSDESVVEWFALEAIGGNELSDVTTEANPFVEEQPMYFFP